MVIGKRPEPEPVRITTAGKNRREEFDGRVRGYLISMSIRVVCFLGAFAVGPGWLRWVLMAGAVFLPYVAVVMANAVHGRDDDAPLRSGLSGPRLQGPPATPSVEQPPRPDPTRSERDT